MNLELRLGNKNPRPHSDILESPVKSRVVEFLGMSKLKMIPPLILLIPTALLLKIVDDVYEESAIAKFGNYFNKRQNLNKGKHDLFKSLLRESMLDQPSERRQRIDPEAVKSQNLSAENLDAIIHVLNEATKEFEAIRDGILGSEDVENSSSLVNNSAVPLTRLYRLFFLRPATSSHQSDQ